MALKLLGSLESSGGDLQVLGTIKTSTHGDGLVFGSPTTVKFKLGVYGNNDLLFKDPNNNVLMTLTSAGDVGIGTSSPDASLHVASTTNDYVAKFSHSTATGYAPGSILLQASQATSRGQGIYHYNTNADESWFTGVPYNVSSNKWIVANKPDTTFNPDVAQLSHALLTIEDNGRVGIGTTSPLEKLHVVGKINSSNNIVSNSTYTMFTGRSNRTVDDYGGLNKQYFKANLVTPGPNTTGESSAHGIADLRFQLANSAGNTNMSDIMTLRSGGNVGIGTTAPAQKVHVVGNRVRLDTSGGGYYLYNTSGTFRGAFHDNGTTTNIFGDGNGSTPAISIESNNSTFAGNVTLSSTAPILYLANTTSSTGKTWRFSSAANGNAYITQDGVIDAITLSHTSGNATFAGDITTGGDINVPEYVVHNGDTNTHIRFTADRIRLVAGGTVKFDSNSTYVVDSAPAAPTNLSLSVVNDTINVTFTASATSGIDSYFVFSSVDGGDHSLISMIAPDDFGATMSVIDNAFDATGTQAYRIYAVKNGIISADLTGSISYSVTTPLEPTNMSVVNLNTAFYVQWDAPSANARFVTAYNVYKHEHATESSLDRDSATLIYSGNNYSYMYQINGSDNNNFHKFWVETTIS